MQTKVDRFVGGNGVTADMVNWKQTRMNSWLVDLCSSMPCWVYYTYSTAVLSITMYTATDISGVDGFDSSSPAPSRPVTSTCSSIYCIASQLADINNCDVCTKI